jgi:hypothetical protein
MKGSELKFFQRLSFRPAIGSPNASGKASADLKKAIAAVFDAAGINDARAQDTLINAHINTRR